MLPWLAESSVIAALLALLAALASRSRRLGPATRHLLWLLVVVRLLMPPVLAWPIPRIAALADVSPIASAGPVPDAPPLSIEDFEPSAAIDALPLEEVALENVAVESSSIRPAAADPEPDRPISQEFWLLGLWVAGSVGWLAHLGRQLSRFRGRIVGATEAPKEIESILVEIGRAMGVRAPEVRVVEGLETPMLWCLGRPILLLPSSLIGTLDPRAWRGVLAHELAHLRRGDPWFGRLLMLGGVLFWWHPLFRLARARVEAEAELACDAWVVGILPDCRRRYAEALVDVCEIFSLGRVPAPALGVGSRPGRFLERRLKMILRERVSPRTSPAALLALGLLGALSVPSWTLGQDDPGQKVIVVTTDDPKPEPSAKPKPSTTPESKPEAADPSKPGEHKIIFRREKDGQTHFDVEIDGKPINFDELKRIPAFIQSQIEIKGLDGVDGDEIVKKVKEALDKANVDEATRSAIVAHLNQAKAGAIKLRGRSQLSAAEAQVQRAKAQLAAAEARLKAETEKVTKQAKQLEEYSKYLSIKGAQLEQAQGAKLGQGIKSEDAAKAKALTLSGGSADAPRADLEQRMEKLESKVDALLEELRALRKEKSGETKPTSEARADFSREIGLRR